MRIQQVFLVCLCGLLDLQQITAVVNNGQKIVATSNANITINSATNGSNLNDDSLKPSNISGITDSVAESSEHETNRREAPPLTDSYGAPIPLKHSYAPSPSNVALPVPVYGVPDSPSNNVVYPAPPPDIPPPVQNLPTVYGPPKNNYGAPNFKYGPPSFSRPLKPHISHSSGPKPIYGPPLHPRPQHGPPIKSGHNFQKLPKPIYGPPFKPPKSHYGPPKHVFVPHKPQNTYGVPQGFINIPKDFYGPPKNNYASNFGSYATPPHKQYGPPQPIPHGPPHPGAPAPPTPPDIKYDGWQPIPGLVSRPPSGTHNGFKGHSHEFHDLHFNNDFIPPSSGGHGPGIGGSYNKGNSGISDSYGAPLSSVTGSGGIFGTSGNSHRDIGGINHGLSAVFGAGDHQDQNALTVVKSVGYEILPHSGKTGLTNDFNGGSFLGDTYTAPPLNSHSPNGPYAASHFYNGAVNNFASSLASSFDTTLLGNFNGFGQDFGSNIGLIPPSGVYGLPPTGKYGTPLLQPSSKYKGGYYPPKHPVMFRDPVPTGLIESIGNSVIQKDAQGIIENPYSNHFTGPAYVPPPVPDVSKPVNEERPSGPSNLYSLPNKDSTSFQNYVHGSSTAGLNNNFVSNFNFNGDGTSAAAVSNYNTPLQSIDLSYGLPHGSGVPIALPMTGHNFGASQSFDTSNHYASQIAESYSTPYVAYQNVANDCSQRQQALPSLSFGVPAANSYSASLASLNTNIAGAYQGQSPSLNYASPDLQAAHSEESDSLSHTNSLEQDKREAEATGKSLAENFGADSELIKSQSIDFNNIPLQGALGTYTLQIQSADNGAGVVGVPHDQVLNNGLLQSILNVIEQPQQNTATILGQPLLHLQQLPPQQSVGANQIYETIQDSTGENSEIKDIILIPPALQGGGVISKEASGISTEQNEVSKESSLPLIDNNEIALYFNNNAENLNAQRNIELEQTKTNLEGSDVLNGQHYGSYVSFKTPDSSVVYGTFKNGNGTVLSDLNTGEVKT